MSRRYPLANLFLLGLVVFICLPIAHGQLFSEDQIVGGGPGDEEWPKSENQMYLHQNVVYMVWQVDRPGDFGGVFSRMRRSLDGGYTWQPFLELGPGTATLHFGGNSVYALVQRTEITTKIADLRRSTDGGASFDQPREIFRQFEYYGDVEIFANGNAVFFYYGVGNNHAYRRSTDAGQTFSPPQTFPEPGWNLTYAADGNNIYISYFSQATGGIVVRRSADNGETYEPITLIPTPSAAKQSISITDGRVLLVWSGVPVGGNRLDVFVARSANQAQTFSIPINLSRTATRSDIDPRISASGSNVMVVFNDEASVFLARSTDGGVSFFDAVDVSDPTLANRAQVRIYNSHVYLVYEASNGSGFRRTRYHVSTDSGATFLRRQVIFRQGTYPQLELINNVPLISPRNYRSILFRRSRPLPLRGPVLKKLLVQEPELF